MQRNAIETILGAIVLIVAAMFLFTALKSGDVKVEAGYPVKAKFDNITGISIGSDVRLGGIKIGVVTGLDLDNQTYQAVATLNIRNQTKIPSDSSAAIASSGLLGDKFVQITPGASDEMLADNGMIEYTQSSVSLEELIGKFVFSSGGVDKDNPPASNSKAPEAATPELNPM